MIVLDTHIWHWWVNQIPGKLSLGTIALIVESDNILANYVSLEHVPNPSIPVGGFLERRGCFSASGIFGFFTRLGDRAGCSGVWSGG